MNREEAIYFANCLKNNYTVDLDDMEAFCDMAIKALAQEPTTKNNLGVDCIDRAEVIKRVEKEISNIRRDEYSQRQNDYCDGYKFALEVLMAEINKLPSVTPQLSVPEVTALAEWTEKLTKASEDAYNKGYADGMKAQEPRKGHWIGQKKTGFGEWKECIVPLKDGFVTDSCSCSECGDWLTGSDEYQCSGNFCPNCGADMREVEK